MVENVNNKPCTACSEIGAPAGFGVDIRLVKVMPEEIDLYHKKAQWVCKEHRVGFKRNGYRIIYV